jgi:hypothetical protein
MSQFDKNGNKLHSYTLLTNCTNIGNEAPACPAGWESVGLTQPGSCTIGNAPGDGPNDVYKMMGYQRVCKRRIPTSNDMGVDCCSNLFGISQSLECKKFGYTPYNSECNNIMAEKCNTNIRKDFAGPVWEGMPGGQESTFKNSCNGRVITPNPPTKPGCLDEFCVNYLRNAPPSNYYSTHSFNDTLHDFPRYGYSTPNFYQNTWGYQPMRKSYTAWNDYTHQNSSGYCQQFPNECQNGRPNAYHF